MMTKIVAHAGCEGTAAGSRENLETDIRFGADIAEVDLRLVDGTIYLSHNPVDQEHLEKYLTLQEAIDILRPTGLEVVCDLKEERVLIPAMELFSKAGMEKRVFFAGDVPEEDVKPPFWYVKNIEQYSFVQRGNKLNPEQVQKLVQVFQNRPTPTLAGFNVEYRMLTPEAIAVFRENHVPLSCWRVDDESEIRDFVNYGVEFLISNSLRFAVTCRNEARA